MMSVSPWFQVFGEDKIGQITLPRPKRETIKMAPSETTRPFFYFSTHNHARPTRIKPAGEHMFVANVREYQGQRAPGARVVARAAPAIFRFWTITHRKKLKK